MARAPSEFPPPIDVVGEFVGPPTDPEEERIEVGIAIVGGGPAGLACAIRLMQILEGDPELLESLGEVPVAVIEKGKTPGAHELSGAVMRPQALRELLPDVPESEWPVRGEVPGEAVYVLPDAKRAVRIPTPPPFRNHGNVVLSIAELTRWLGEKAEEAGVYVLAETSATKLLVEDGAVRGVRTADRGLRKDGTHAPNFEPGSDVVARATVLADGNWGHLSGAAVREFGLGAEDPPVWALGVKEVWEVPKPLRQVVHTLGWPLRVRAKYREFGGAWIYPMGETMVSIGFVTGLDYTDATLSPHDTLQLFKSHPLVRGILDGGRRVGWGAKAIPEGGWWAVPKLAAPGAVILGDAGSLVNVPELKGIHYAIHSGIYAAETIAAQLKQGSNDFTAYDTRVRESYIGRDLYRTRNMKQPFGRGFFLGGLLVNLMVLTKGRFPAGHWRTHRDSEVEMFVGDRRDHYPQPDNAYFFDKLSSVYLSGTAVRDDAPNHIRIQQRVPRVIAETWVSMCPAGVYEIADGAPTDPDAEVDLIVNHTNCVQCGAITAKGGRLTPPEGGDGPNYRLQ